MVAALIGADDLRVYQIARDEELIAMIRQRAVDFWFNHVIAEIPPPIQTSDDASKMLRKFDGLTVGASREDLEAVTRLKGIKKAITRLKESEGHYELAIKVALSAGVPADTPQEVGKFALVGENGKPVVTWNLQNRAAYEVKASSFRVLRLK